MIEIQIKIEDPRNDDYFIITEFDASSIWISRKDGEGMQIKNANLFDIINKFFTENH